MAYKDLTEKQKRFVDEYIITFNATQSAINAKYSEKSARQMGTENLSKPSIREAIKERVTEAKDRAEDRIQDVEETLAQDSSIARKEQQISVYKEVDLTTGEVVKHVRREYTPSDEEAGRARERIYKVNGAYLDRKEVKAEIQSDKLDSILEQLVDDEAS